MVEVFKTNVRQKRKAGALIEMLSESLPHHKINFDLEDCDKILRIEGKNISPKSIITLVKENGFQCSILEYVISIHLMN